MKFLIVRLASLAMKVVCETHEKRVLLQISFCESRNEIYVCESRYPVLILTCESHKNFGSKKRDSLLARI